MVNCAFQKERETEEEIVLLREMERRGRERLVNCAFQRERQREREKSTVNERGEEEGKGRAQ